MMLLKETVIPWLRLLVQAFWIVATACACGPMLSARLGRWHRYGKLRSSAATPSDWLDICVPKRWFAHFYLVGSAWNLAVLLSAPLWFPSPLLASVDVLGALALLEVHLLRQVVCRAAKRLRRRATLTPAPLTRLVTGGCTSRSG